VSPPPVTDGLVKAVATVDGGQVQVIDPAGLWGVG
jgi:hypothetical protein